ncbi:hypothetical protein DIS18_11925 [Algibacter marinivivus]|uniref:histidine kinase n=1 Tax=Algibacter marinivivus TaxID=2100723 RepID=A0A2U2X2H3_9FLAO|nr:two-component regulator propeller domain-containing protein [Algibacter marinivivus]PWH81970.1 hypothetical protein DIS18_11925 [Algibacter marinivivus]
MKKLSLILPYLFCCLLQSQQNVIHYNINNGLPHDVTYGLFQASNGYLWIGTDDGLVKFDGNSFKVYTSNDGLTSNFVIDIAELSNKSLAIATWRGGLNLFNPKKEEFTNTPKGPKKLSNLVVFKDTIYNYHDFRNLIFWHNKDSIIETKQCVYKPNESYDLNEFPSKKFKYYSVAYKVIEDSLYKYSSHKFKEALKGIYIERGNKTELKFKFLKHKVITALVKKDSHTFIAGSENNLLIFDDEKLIKVVELSINNTRISKLLVHGDNIYFLSSDSKGFKYLYYYNLQTETLKNVIKALKINATVSDILLDHERNLWISTFGDGLYCKLNTPKSIYNIPINKNIIDLEFNNDKTLLLSNRTLSIIKNFNLEDEIPLHGFGKHISKVEDKVIVSSLDIKASYALDETITEQYGYGYFNLNDEAIQIESNEIKFINAGKTCFYDKLRYNIFDVAKCQNTLYFGTNDGLYQYDKIKNLLIKTVTKNVAFDNSIVNALLEKDDTLIIGSNNGLWKLANNYLHLKNEEDGLINKQINALNFDSNGNVWIGTQKGVSIYNGKTFSNLNTESGIITSYISKIKEDKNEDIWITGNNGVSILNSEISNYITTPPVLDISNNDLSFSYNTIAYNRSKITSQYKLNKTNWVNLDNRKGILDFSNYRKGNYTLQFRAKKIDSDWANSKIFSFNITIPWYKQSWLLLIASLLIASIIIIFILKKLEQSKLKTKNLQVAIAKRNQLENELIAVRHNIAQDFHDDLGNKLARISILSNLLEDDNANLDSDNKELLKQITSDADYLYKGTKDFIFSLKTESDYLEEVITYLSDFGEDYMKQFNIVFEVEKAIYSNIKLPYYWSKQLIFIFKEVLTNVVKHAKCNRVILSFIYDGEFLKISCEDNGIGFNIKQSTSKGGLQNIKNRASAIGGELTINSNTNNTKIIFSGKPHN